MRIMATFAKKTAMKRLFLLCILTGTCLFSHAQYNAMPSVVSLTVGFGNLLYGRDYQTTVPPLLASYEFEGMPQAFGVKELSIGFGGCAGFMAVRSTSVYGKATLHSHISEMLVALKVTGHYRLLPIDELDTYGAVLLGWGIAGSVNNWEGDPETIAIAKSLGWEHRENIGGPFIGIMAGCRYWFTPQLAGNVEIGYGPAFLNIGGSYRF